MQEKVFNKGDVIFREGDYGESFFRVVEGSVEVIIDYQGENEKKLTDLGVGAYFGELAVLEAYPRSATVIALADQTKVKEIGEKEINDYFTQEPATILELFRHIGNRLRTLTADYEEASAVYEKLSGDEKAQDENLKSRISKVLSRFIGRHQEPISAETQQAIENSDFTAGFAKDTADYKAGTVIFREGEPGRCLYFIHGGRIGIYADYGKPEQKLLTELFTGKSFGEMGMISNEVRSATAVAEEDSTLEIIGPDDLEELFTKNPLKVDMLLQNLSGRLRRLTTDYSDLCKKIQEKQGA